MSSNKFPLSRSENLVVQDLKNEILIYDLKINKAFSLNETSALVWQGCDGTKDVSQIAGAVGEKLKTPVSEALVQLALDELIKENLIANGSKLESGFNGLSRREVIKRVGLGTMAALPLISTLVAPSAINAASLTACTFACAGNPPVASDTCPQGFCCESTNCTSLPGGGFSCTGTCRADDDGPFGGCGLTC